MEPACRGLLREMNNSSVAPIEENFDEVATWLRVLNGILLSLFLIFSILGNGAVILLVIFNKNLHYRSIVVSLGLVVADLLVALVWNLLGLASTAAGEWPFGDLGCTVLGTMLLCVLYARWLEIAVVTLDRFFIILSPFNYYRYSKPLQVVLTILAWTVPVLIIATPAATNFGSYRYRLILTTCSVDCFETNPCYSFYVGVFGTFVTIGGVLPTVLYSIMYCIGRRKRSTMAHSLGTVERESSTVSSGESSQETVSPSESRHDQDTSNVRLKARDRRALMTFFITFVTLLLTQIPIFITSGALRNTSIFEKVPLWIHFIAMYIFLLSPVFTPMVIMRNKDFRRGIASVIKRTRTIMPLVTERQIQQFRRNSSVGFSVYSTNGSQTDISVAAPSRRYSLPNLTGVHNGISNSIQTVIEESSQESS